MGNLIIIGEKLNKDLKRLVSIIDLNGGCIDEIKIQCLVFLSKEKTRFKYRFKWNGFIPYSRELTNQLKILVKLGLLYKNDSDEYCIPDRLKSLNTEKRIVEHIKELINLSQEDLIEEAKKKFFEK